MLRRAAMCAALALALLGPPGSARAQAPAPAATAPVVEARELDRKRRTLTDEGRYEEAIPVAARLVTLKEQLYGADHPDTLEHVHFLATLHRWTGAWAAAEPLYQRVLDALARTGRTGHVQEERALRGLVELYVAKGDLERAEPIAGRLVREMEARSPASVALAVALMQLAEVHREKGAWTKAEALLLRALSLVQKYGEPASISETATTDERGEPVGGESWRSRTRDGEGAILSRLAQLFLAAGDFGRAQEHAARAVAAQEETSQGQDTPGLGRAVHDLGRVLAAKGDGAGALREYARSLRIREKTQGADHADVATVLHSEAMLRTARGEAAEAEALARRALAILEKTFGPEHGRVADVLLDIAGALVSQGRVAEAVPLADRAAAIHDRDAQAVLAVGSEAQRRALSAARRKRTDAIVSLSAYHAPGDRGAARLALRAVLRDKGRLIDAAASELRVLRSRLGRPEQELFDALERVTASITASAARGDDVSGSPEARGRVARLSNERRRLERAIADRSARYRAASGLVTVEEVAAAMPDGAALVEGIVYRPFLLPAARATKRPDATAVPWGEPRYAAFVLRRGVVTVKDLGPTSAVDAAVERLREAFLGPDLRRDPRPAARAAYALILAPLEEAIGDAEHLLWSPDGALQLVPIGALAGGAGRYVVESRLVTYLGSGRDLLRFEAPAATRQGPLLIGAPDFGALPGVPAAKEAERRSAPGVVDMARVGFPPLPGTAKEVGAVRDALGRGVVLTGGQATESVVKRARSPGVLHVATHGFFLPGRSEEAITRSLGLDATPAETTAALAVESPLVRSGIALAGANLRTSGNDDGILTALEAATLDLDGTELVVLSACETGLGAAVPGDGVHGLRRAFAIAGAETLVMSLWQVDSGRTRELMTAYYQGLGEGAGRSEALRRAQLAMLGDERTAHPNVWASFIVSGAWGPLRSVPARPPAIPPGARGCACRAAGEGAATSGWLALIPALVLGARRSSPRRHTSRAK